MPRPKKGAAAPRAFATVILPGSFRSGLHGGLDREAADRTGGHIEIRANARVLADLLPAAK